MSAAKTRAGRLKAMLRNAVFCAALLGGSAVVIFVFQPFGDRRWWSTVLFGLLTVVLIPRSPAPRLPRPARAALSVVLALWISLTVWSAISPGGPILTRKADPAAIRVLTWNILVGAEASPPWVWHGWPVRKHALRSAVRAAAPDILCVQEALEGQVAFLQSILPGHQRVGAGRDDGLSAGEHCAIYFDANRFEQLGSGTFWLEEPAGEPPGQFELGPKRICTWVRLRDRSSGRTLRVYNTHSYLTERARLRAARMILAHIASATPVEAVMVAGDFNAPPRAPSRRLFDAAGLVSVAKRDGHAAGAPTFQFYGIRLKCLDGILLSREFRLREQRVVDVKPGNTFPSDHFGILADVSL
jgi:endonuclease/exonuclease/phosphatase family metal-dependent hydrolase